MTFVETGSAGQRTRVNQKSCLKPFQFHSWGSAPVILSLLKVAMGAGGQSSGIKLEHIKQRLFTKEDTHPVLGVHKLLGIGCLMHYIYRFTMVLFKVDMGFSSTWQTAVLIGAHALLSVSSMILRKSLMSCNDFWWRGLEPKSM